MHDHPHMGAVLEASQKWVNLTPRGERRVIERTQHGPMSYLSDDAVGYVLWVGNGGGMVGHRWSRNRPFKPSREPNSEDLYPLALLWGDGQLSPSF